MPSSSDRLSAASSDQSLLAASTPPLPLFLACCRSRRFSAKTPCGNPLSVEVHRRGYLYFLPPRNEDERSRVSRVKW
ncbi:hypothetical protein L596_009459 [Steinernema carpocapsae]|uniref:Uncharacterized protein n=1 Tax=Steinernema carpocapsae TaxID=34508 RepID=A0A4U5PFL6_STECR|nr:hypothetical protein L596_009459 [Steinernema carpocapsae]